MKKARTLLYVLVAVAWLAKGAALKAQDGFPFILPAERPDRKLSAAVERNYDNFAAPRPEDNELFSLFKYTKLAGFNYNSFDGTITRRDPSKIVLENGKYYMYYQAFSVFPKVEGDYCPVAVSAADSPDGPWTPLNQVVIPNGEKDEWGGYSIHDPYPLVHDGRIYLYYKSDFDVKERRVRRQGLAIADNPLGPFRKHPLNPVLNSGHETTLFPFKEGIAALVIRDGNEHFTIQYAEDGVHFEIASITELMPVAAGPFVPDVYYKTGMSEKQRERAAQAAKRLCEER